MPKRVEPTDFDVVIRFGGGINSITTEDEIDDREAADGFNFELGIHQGGEHVGKPKELRPRHPFDLVATAPNAGSIRGGGSLLKADGTVKTFIQAGDTVYEFDGSSFTASPVLDTVNASAKLRGHWRSHNWTLDDKLLITDLALVEPVKEWNGTTWQDVTFQSGASLSFGAFHAKYCAVTNERALFAHIKDAGGTFGHMMVGSAREDHTTISVADRPSSSLSEADPFFLLTPDLKPINGHIDAFRANIVSSEKGRIFNLSGESAQDFAFEDFFAGSAASGEESLAYVGNDVIYGRQGRIESIRNVDQFGNTEADDLTKQIADIVRTYTGWTVVYNSRLNRVYAFPTGESEVWVCNTEQLDIARQGGISPWMRWRTSTDLAFQPTFVAALLDPSDGLEYVFMGDSSGNLYRLEGSSHDGDAGTNNIAVEYVTKLYSMPVNAEAYGLEGYIRYRKGEAVTVRLTFEFAGTSIFNQSVEVNLPATEGSAYYGGEFYYGDDTYYGEISGKLSRQHFGVAGQSNEFQVRINVDSVDYFAITEIGLRFKGVGTGAR